MVPKYLVIYSPLAGGPARYWVESLLYYLRGRVKGVEVAEYLSVNVPPRDGYRMVDGWLTARLRATHDNIMGEIPYPAPF